MLREQDIANHVNIAAAEEEEQNNIGEYSSSDGDEHIEDYIDDDESSKHLDIQDQDNMIEPSIQDETISQTTHQQTINLDQDEDQDEYDVHHLNNIEARNRFNRFRNQQRGPRLNAQIDDDDDDDQQESDSGDVIVEHIMGNNVGEDCENGINGDDEYDAMD